MSAHLGLVHTVPALAPRFDADLRGTATSDLRLTHVVDADLLARAVQGGVDEDVRRTLSSHLIHLADGGARTLLVTCSSIGEATDEVAPHVDATVIRVDRAMAIDAARRAASVTSPTITALATLTATLGPTQRLLAAEAERLAPGTRVTAEVVANAAEARAAGDQPRHDALILDAIDRAVRDGATVIVLAQASMATAVAGESRQGVPVLTSIPFAVGATLAAIKEHAQ